MVLEIHVVQRLVGLSRVFGVIVFVGGPRVTCMGYTALGSLFVTLTDADSQAKDARYLWRCAACSRIYGVNLPPTPVLTWEEAYDVGLVSSNGQIRNPQAADECREAALRCCARAAVLDPDGHAGQWYRPTPGALPEQARVRRPPSPRFGVPRYEGAIERIPFEIPFTIVPLGSPEVWTRWEITHNIEARPPLLDRGFQLHEVRLDVAIDDVPERQRALWVLLLSGFRLEFMFGAVTHGAYVMQNRHFICEECEKGQVQAEEEFGVRHAFVSFEQRVRPTLSPRARFQTTARYLHGDEIPIAFARLVFIGHTTRDVQ